MTEIKVSIAILISNENIPTEIFSSSVDLYFGPQIEDFNTSSLVICILSNVTGLLPNEDNAATYIKSQWLFMTSVLENDTFEFSVAICDNRNWAIVANEEAIGIREIRTSSITYDKTFLIRINWNKPLTFSIESLTELYSMDESFIKSHYESCDITGYDNTSQSFLEPLQNLDTIQENTDDDESLVDSLQEIINNDEDQSLIGSDDSLQELINLNENSLNNSLEDLGKMTKNAFEIVDLNKPIDGVESGRKPHIVEILSEVNDLFGRKVKNYNDDKVNSRNNSEANSLLHLSRKERKEARILKIQSIFGVKSDLETIRKRNIENTAMEICTEICSESWTVPVTSWNEEINSNDDHTHDLDDKKHSTFVPSLNDSNTMVYNTNPNININLDLHDIFYNETLTESEDNNNLLIYGEKDNNGLNLCNLSDEYCQSEYCVEIEDEIPIKVNFSEQLSHLLVAVVVPSIYVETNINYNESLCGRKNDVEAVRSTDEKLELSRIVRNEERNNGDNKSNNDYLHILSIGLDPIIQSSQVSILHEDINDTTNDVNSTYLIAHVDSCRLSGQIMKNGQTMSDAEEIILHNHKVVYSETKGKSSFKHVKTGMKENNVNIFNMKTSQENRENGGFGVEDDNLIGNRMNFQFSDPKMDISEDKNSIRNNEISSGQKNLFFDNNFENHIDINELNDIQTHQSIHDIRRIVKDSVAPTKIETCTPKVFECNIPFMDDDSVFNGSWNEETDDRCTSLETPIASNKDNLVISHELSIHVNPEIGIGILKGDEDSKPMILGSSINKEPRRKRLIALCGCVGDRTVE